MAYPERPSLGEDGNSYLLAVHPKDKDRAKGIGQYRWDPEWKCWVYPKSPWVYDALVAEFGDELDLSKIKGGASKPSRQKCRPVDGDGGVAAQIVPTASARPGTAELDNLVELRVQIKTLERDKQELVDELESARAETAAARGIAKRLQDAMASRKESDTVEQLVKEVALDAANHDRDFAALLGRVEVVDMPIALARCLEGECRRILRIEDERVRLADLLDDLRDSNLLPADAIDLAHVVRKQRNIAAHEEAIRGQRKARALVSLMATSLLWPELRRARDEVGG